MKNLEKNAYHSFHKLLVQIAKLLYNTFYNSIQYCTMYTIYCNVGLIQFCIGLLVLLLKVYSMTSVDLHHNVNPLSYSRIWIVHCLQKCVYMNTYEYIHCIQTKRTQVIACNHPHTPTTTPHFNFHHLTYILNLF